LFVRHKSFLSQFLNLRKTFLENIKALRFLGNPSLLCMVCYSATPPLPLHKNALAGFAGSKKPRG
jgi:hypothetical protein